MENPAFVPVQIVVAQATTYAATHGPSAVTLGDLLASQLTEHDTPENSYAWVRRALQEAEIRLDELYTLLKSVDANARAYTKEGVNTAATNKALRSALTMMVMRGQWLLLPTAVVRGCLEVATEPPRELPAHPVWNALDRWATDAFSMADIPRAERFLAGSDGDLLQRKVEAERAICALSNSLREAHGEDSGPHRRILEIEASFSTDFDPLIDNILWAQL